MMNSKSRLATRLAVGVAFAVSSLGLSGCADPLQDVEPFASGDVPYTAAEMSCDTTPDEQEVTLTRETVVIEAPTSTFVKFGNALAAAEADIRELVGESGAKIATVIADGAPRLTLSRVVDLSRSFDEADDKEAISSAMAVLHMNYYCAVVPQSVNTSAFAPTSGSDFLQALHVATESFTERDAQREIVVIGNGLQDVGQLDLTAEFPADTSSANNFAKNLASAGGLPDLTGVKVSWYGLGQTSQGAQESLHPAAQKALVALWTALIEEAGGELVKVVTTIPYADPVATSIEAKTVAVPEAPCVFMLTSDDGFNFKPDSAEFLDAAKARKGAENMAAEIEKSECSGPLYVVGYAASGVDKKQYNSGAIAKVKSLSAARAAAFKGLLEQSGVKIKLVPVGAGKGPTTDWDLNGKFVEDMGKQNRFVEVTQSKPEAD
jgi:outer membrane protein OmpA-like peptidoglycan-associated protein